MNTRWIASWTAAPMNIWSADAPLSGFYGQTLREFFRLSLGGTAIVIRLSNEHGTKPIELDAVSLAHAGENGCVQPLSSRAVTFGGRPTVTIYPGSAVVSDPVVSAQRPFARLAVSYYSRGFLPLETHHLEAQQTAYISVPGDFTAAGEMIVQQSTTSHYLLSAAYVEASPTASAVVCFGDSITDGYGSTIDADRRWPDILAERLSALKGFEEISVLNKAIGGNRLIHSCRGARALERFDRDVLSYSNVSHLVILMGINDIIWPHTILAGPQEAVNADQIIGALQQLLARSRLAGLKTMLCTLLPFEGANPEFPKGGYYTVEKERIRQAVNRYIRNGAGADSVTDFDELLRDPSRTTRLRPEYDSGDHIHPNDIGYRAMAEAFDINFLK